MQSFLWPEVAPALGSMEHLTLESRCSEGTEAVQGVQERGQRLRGLLAIANCLHNHALGMTPVVQDWTILSQISDCIQHLLRSAAQQPVCLWLSTAFEEEENKYALLWKSSMLSSERESKIKQLDLGC